MELPLWMITVLTVLATLVLRHYFWAILAELGRGSASIHRNAIHKAEKRLEQEKDDYYSRHKESPL